MNTISSFRSKSRLFLSFFLFEATVFVEKLMNSLRRMRKEALQEADLDWRRRPKKVIGRESHGDDGGFIFSHHRERERIRMNEWLGRFDFLLLYVFLFEAWIFPGRATTGRRSWTTWSFWEFGRRRRNRERWEWDTRNSDLILRKEAKRGRRRNFGSKREWGRDYRDFLPNLNH